MKFLQDNGKSNIIMLYIPHKYDLPDNSHINDIKTFKSKLKKIPKLFKRYNFGIQFYLKMFYSTWFTNEWFGKGLS
jgi:hypothetical protein